MKLSTRTRYGVRLMLDLACRYSDGPVYLRDIAVREDLSEKYLSQIIIPLRSRGLVLSTRGAHGGYTLSRPPGEITLWEIMEPLEGGGSLVDCVEHASVCHRVPTCAARDIWTMVGEKISESLNSVTLGDLVRMSRDKAGNDLTQNI
jgi:Rrf2 family protein